MAFAASCLAFFLDWPLPVATTSPTLTRYLKVGSCTAPSIYRQRKKSHNSTFSKIPVLGKKDFWLRNSTTQYTKIHYHKTVGYHVKEDRKLYQKQVSTQQQVTSHFVWGPHIEKTDSDRAFRQDKQDAILIFQTSTW